MDDTWTADELNTAVNGLLNGCEYHYRKAVTCVSCMSSVIPSEEKSDFCQKCKNFLTAREEEFFQMVEDIHRKWPRTEKNKININATVYTEVFWILRLQQ